jgi:predicted nuclease of predicted toxin-antitoxin system
MRIVADESVERQISDALRDEGHDVYAITDETPSIPDEDVLAVANDRQALLITADKDFGELVFRQGLAHHGILLCRLEGQSPEDKADIVQSVFRLYGPDMQGGFSVITPRAIRIRPS